ncbi:hypothetical protein [Synechococcus sp. PCC 7336]|uniref:calcium-binding protein n=1 Tax=Synechococcus sp. PCC 7336 TaxID=195250 RepID=UPI0005709C26|nr:hypothetical protein [Synechococcus sp. PCC 7336]
MVLANMGIPSNERLMAFEFPDIATSIAAFEDRVETIDETFVDSLSAFSGISNSLERAALVSLAFNAQTTLTGQGLPAAFTNGDRAEAFYEIRYNTNPSLDLGEARRRYIESEVFGLYAVSNPDPDFRPSETDALKVFRTFNKHEERISLYEATLSAAIRIANDDIAALNSRLTGIEIGNVLTTQEEFELARDVLIENFGTLPEGIQQALSIVSPGNSLLTPSALEGVFVAASAQGIAGANQPAEVAAFTVDRVAAENRNNRIYDGTDDLIFGSIDEPGVSVGNDTLRGGSGNDLFIGGLGEDFHDGGSGEDTVSFLRSTAGVTVDLQLGTGSGGQAADDRFVNIENAIGSEAGDNLIGNDANNLLIGHTGNDRLEGGIGDDILLGGDGDDTAFFNLGLEDLEITENEDGTFTISSEPFGTDTLQGIEFLELGANDGRIFQLPLEDGPESSLSETLFSSEGEDIGTLNFTLPSFTLDGDVDYSFEISALDPSTQFNFAYIIDTSGSTGGGILSTIQQTFTTLTNDLIATGIADISQFAVIEFNSFASTSITDSAEQAIAIVNSFTSGGSTNFGVAISEGLDFFNSVPDTGTNIAFFLSDGFGSGASSALQSVADVRAFGVGTGASLSALQIIDPGAVLLTDPSDLTAALNQGEISLEDIELIQIVREDAEGNREILDQIDPSAPSTDPNDTSTISENAVAITATGNLENLDVSLDAENRIFAEVTFSAEFQETFGIGTTEIAFTVTSGGGIGSPSAGDDVLQLGLGDTDISAGAGNDTITGNNSANEIDGQSGGDRIFGGGGDDILTGGSGSDTIDGGDGFDIAVFDFNVAQAGEIERVGSSLSLSGTNDVLINVEQLEFTDAVVDGDTLEVTPRSPVDPLLSAIAQLQASIPPLETSLSTLLLPELNNQALRLDQLLETINRFDIFTLSPSQIADFQNQFDNIQASITALPNDLRNDNTFTGTAGADNLSGGLGNDTILGADGSDRLNGDDGNDVLQGGNDNDTLVGGSGSDTLEGGNGSDRLEGGSDSDSLLGEVGTDTLLGGAGRDTLDGGGSDDRLKGGDGNDLLAGGEGRDTLLGEGGEDTLAGGTGNDQLTGADGNDLLEGNEDNDTLLGNSGSDTLLGGSGNDLLRGGEKADLLEGNDGDDTIRGGNGADTLIGGSDFDLLIGGSGNDLLNGGNGSDTLQGTGGNRGAGEWDTLLGGFGNDLFVLGNNGGTFYSSSGQDDFATIADFIVGEDTIQLHGNASDYLLGQSSANAADVVLLLDRDRDGAIGGGDELIATIAGGAGLQLQSSAFSFV